MDKREFLENKLSDGHTTLTGASDGHTTLTGASDGRTTLTGASDGHTTLTGASELLLAPSKLLDRLG